MKKQARHETYLPCPDPSIAESLKQGDVVRVSKQLKNEIVEADFIVRYYEQRDDYNDNWFVVSFTQQLNKALGKPKSFMLEETLVFNKDNMDRYLFTDSSVRRHNMAKVARKNRSTLS